MSERNDSTRLDEAALSEHLKGGSAVSQRYREISNEEVPADLDRRVLAMARAAAAPDKARERAWRRSAWIAPLALAASAVLVVSIVIESGVYRGVDPTVSREVFAPPLPATQPAEVLREEAVRDQRAEPASAPPVDTRVAAPPTEPAAVRAKKAAAIAAEAKRAQRVLEDAAAARAEAPLFAPSPPAALAQEAESAKARASEAESAEAQPPVVVASQSVQPLHQESPSAEVGVSEIAVTGVRARRDAAGGRGPRDTVRAASPPSEAQASSAEAPRAPEDWLEDIRELRDAGRVREADEEWERFRKSHPDYLVAEDDRARPHRR